MYRYFAFALLFFTAAAFGQTSPKNLLQQLQNSQPDTNRVKVQLQLGNYYQLKPGEVKSDLDSALIFFNQALQLSDQQHATYLHIRALKGIANTYFEAKDIKEAIATVKKLVKVCHQLGDKVQEATNLLMIANKTNVPDEADGSVREAILIIDRIEKRDPNLARLLLDAGKYYLLKPGSEKSDMDNAFKYLQEADVRTEGTNNDLRAQVLGYLGNYYIEAGEFEKGHAYLKDVLAYYQKKGDETGELITWIWMGNLLFNNGRNDHKKERIECFEKAAAIYRKANYPDLAIGLTKRIADQWIKLKDGEHAMASFKTIANYYHAKNNKLAEAEAWGNCGKGLFTQHILFDEAVKCFERQRSLLHDTGKEVEELEATKNIADVHMTQGKYNLAEKELLGLVPRFKAIGYKRNYTAYNLLAEINRHRGNQLKELSYRLESLRDMEKYNLDSQEQIQGYISAIVNYQDLNMWDKSFALVLRLRKLTQENTTGLWYIEVMLGTSALVAERKLNEAWRFLTSATKAFPEGTLLNTNDAAPAGTTVESMAFLSKFYINEAYGMYYNALGQNTKAEKHYLVALKDWELKFRQDETKDENLRILTLVSKFYLKINDYKKADHYIKKGSLISTAPVDAKVVQRWLYKVDSAAGNYLSAINHLKQYQRSSDSLFSFSNNKKVMDMEVAFETRHKQDLINGLESKNKLQELKYQEAKTTRNWIISLSAMLLLFSGVLYNRFRLKQRSNRLLESKQKEINSQNDNLQQLLTEKDWLLKEVHHRVKNNLQIVMSLLSSQSAYLENNAAIEAIRESQNRVQAISLIHQKLYSGNNVASINMPAYVADLLSYLADSFDTGRRRIRFEQLIEPINLDLSQAVPLGLILNEAVTNAIKYAFGAAGGQIIVALQLIKDESLLLTITDNGKGLPADFDLRTASSLGMEMMKALSHQLGGEFKIANNAPGVNITIEFQVEKMLPHAPAENLYN